MARLALLSLLLPVVVLAAKLPLPSFVKPCSIKDQSKWNECVTKSAAAVVRSLSAGDAKYRLPSLEPLLINDLVLVEKGSPLGVEILADDVKLWGLNVLEFNKAVHSENPNEDTYDVFCPVMNIKAKYKVNGKLLLLPIVGEGDGVFKVDNVHITYKHNWELKKKKDGETYYIPSRGSTRLNTTRLHVRLDNLFNGDKALGDTTNSFLNENWQELFDALSENIAAVITEVCYTAFKGVYEQVPYKNLFLDTGL